ncbi:MAG: RsmF rRNA methyltransferase first C-terminal domain-containing protein [Thermincolia bacterium]
MNLPAEFLERMQRLLGSEYQEFMDSFNLPRYYGLRVNTLKIPVADFQKVSPFDLESVPWAKDGFYYREGERPAKHPYYHAGLYYIQEPSAMAPGAFINAQPGERVLDLCAAPGGKSTQVAAGLQGQGVLVANDIHPERVKALVKNLELFGVGNAVVTNETPDRLAQRFAGYFDKILIDAPCSGEGMFRKDEEAARSWGIHSVTTCVGRQREILKEADKMLRPGGMILYSTCTFAPEEDEGMIEEFLSGHVDYQLVDIPKDHGLAPGKPEWTGGRPELAGAARLWPHKLAGEGHFMALLRKNGEPLEEIQRETFIDSETEVSLGKKGKAKAAKAIKATKGKGNVNQPDLQDFYNFTEESLNIAINGDFEFYGEHLYLKPQGLPDFHGLKVTRPGWYLGMLKKNRFEPSQALALGLKRTDAKRVIDLAHDSREVIRYLKGETLDGSGDKGWTLVCVDGYPLGWAKQVEGSLKNYYPKGWRWLD